MIKDRYLFQEIKTRRKIHELFNCLILIHKKEGTLPPPHQGAPAIPHPPIFPCWGVYLFMENHEPLFNEVKDIVSGIRALMDRAYQQYSSLVDAVIKDEITDINQIERIMDGLVDLGDDVRFIEIYRKLCRHVYNRYPQLVGEHVTMFRAQFETANDADSPEPRQAETDTTE